MKHLFLKLIGLSLVISSCWLTNFSFNCELNQSEIEELISLDLTSVEELNYRCTSGPDFLLYVYFKTPNNSSIEKLLCEDTLNEVKDLEHSLFNEELIWFDPDFSDTLCTKTFLMRRKEKSKYYERQITILYKRDFYEYYIRVTLR